LPGISEDKSAAKALTHMIEHIRVLDGLLGLSGLSQLHPRQQNHFPS
jgi:hypothetical protein